MDLPNLNNDNNGENIPSKPNRDQDVINRNNDSNSRSYTPMSIRNSRSPPRPRGAPPPGSRPWWSPSWNSLPKQSFFAMNLHAAAHGGTAAQQHHIQDDQSDTGSERSITPGMPQQPAPNRRLAHMGAQQPAAAHLPAHYAAAMHPLFQHLSEIRDWSASGGNASHGDGN